jgi:drug/metabolite transporter (DMT)-like permease
MAMLASAGFLSLRASTRGFSCSPPHFTMLGWLAVLFIGMNSGIGYHLWLWSLDHTTPTKATVFLALSPVTAVALVDLRLGEPISAMTGLGLGLVALDLCLANVTRGGPIGGVGPAGGRSP